MTDAVNLINISGGKDSAATALVAMEQAQGDLRFVFADTGHEHPLTYEHVAYLDEEFKKRCGQGIQTVRADFTERMATRRENIQKKWGESGVPQDRIDRAKELLQPTGNPMLDLCMLKGRFPSTMARFCTQELKVYPIHDQVVEPLTQEHDPVVMWHGVRADESRARKNLPFRDVEVGAWEPEPTGVLIIRPLINWTAEDVFDHHRRHNLKWNPLYEMGMGRVGCMPCIFARKSELRQIALHYPEAFEKLREWEEIVSEVSKWGVSTFFPQDKTPGDPEDLTRSNAEAVRLWATAGDQGDMFEEPAGCNSLYGLCE